MPYNREKAVAYAHKWAFKRNPAYLDFSNMGGDCTNFISQCLHAGGAAMNYTKTFGWYYSSPGNRAPAWTSVASLYKFLTSNIGVGPFAAVIDIGQIEIGDLVQLSFRNARFSHSLIVVEVAGTPSLETVQIATHTDDSDYRPLSSYTAEEMRFLKIAAR